MATLQERIANIDAILDSGQTVTRIGDRWVEIDLDALAKQRDNLLREMSGVSQYKRVVMERG